MTNGSRHTRDHLLDLGGAELADGVGDGDVGAAAGGLLGGGDLEDTVDVDLEDTLENGLTLLLVSDRSSINPTRAGNTHSAHGGNGSESELSEGGVVLAVNSLSLVYRKLDCLLVISDCRNVKLACCGHFVVRD